MALSQQKFREIVFQLLFSHDFSQVEEEEMTDFMMKQFFVTKSVMRLAEGKRKLIEEKLVQIDEQITKYCLSYDFSRISKVERSILRLAVYELCFDPSLPPKVAIAEAIRLTRKYATAESASFVNAVVDAIYQSELKDKVLEGQNELSLPLPVA